MNSKEDNVGFLFIRGISSRLKRKFKAWCARNGTTMTNEIVKYMADNTRTTKRCSEHNRSSQQNPKPKGD